MFNDMKWEPADWASMIEEKSIVNWLVSVPTEK